MQVPCRTHAILLLGFKQANSLGVWLTLIYFCCRKGDLSDGKENGPKEVGQEVGS